MGNSQLFCSSLLLWSVQVAHAAHPCPETADSFFLGDEVEDCELLKTCNKQYNESHSEWCCNNYLKQLSKSSECSASFSLVSYDSLINIGICVLFVLVLSAIVVTFFSRRYCPIKRKRTDGASLWSAYFAKSSSHHRARTSSAESSRFFGDSMDLALFPCCPNRRQSFRTNDGQAVECRSAEKEVNGAFNNRQFVESDNSIQIETNHFLQHTSESLSEAS